MSHGDRVDGDALNLDRRDDEEALGLEVGDRGGAKRVVDLLRARLLLGCVGGFVAKDRVELHRARDDDRDDVADVRLPVGGQDSGGGAVERPRGDIARAADQVLIRGGGETLIDAADATGACAVVDSISGDRVPARGVGGEERAVARGLEVRVDLELIANGGLEVVHVDEADPVACALALKKGRAREAGGARCRS